MVSMAEDHFKELASNCLELIQGLVKTLSTLTFMLVAEKDSNPDILLVRQAL